MEMKLQEQINRIQEMMGTINESKLQKKLQDEIDSVGFSSFMNQSGLSIEEIANVFKTTPLQLTKDYFLNKSFSIKDFDVPIGGYDFTFEITHIEEKKEGLWYVYAKIGDGGVTLMTTGEYHNLWNLGLWNEDYWWEIQDEITDIIYKILLPFEPKYTQIKIEHNLMY
jgi:hypothetical protein